MIKKKIVFITSEKLPVPPVKGGAVEHWIYEAAQRLKDTYEVYSISIHDPLIGQFEKGEGITFRNYKKGLIAKMLLCSYKLPFKNDFSSLYYLPYSLWAGRQAKKIKADIIHIHSRPHFVPILRFLNPEAKIILHIHNLSVIDYNGKLWEKTLWDKVSLVLACSNYLQEEILKRYPYLKSKTNVIYNGIDTQEISPAGVTLKKQAEIRQQYRISQEDIVLMYAGRLVEYKGAHILIEAFKDIVKDYKKAKLVILGGQTYSNTAVTAYMKQIQELSRGFEDKIIFTNYISHKEIPDFLGLSDIFVMPSLWDEPFGVAIIEAMAMEKPVVAFAKGGIKEIIINNQSGILIENTSAESLREKLSHLIDNPMLRKELGKNARERVEMMFSWPKVINNLISLYEGLN